MVACPSGSCVSLKVNVDDGSDYLIPGQYVQVRPADGTSLVDFVFTSCVHNLLYNIGAREI